MEAPIWSSSKLARADMTAGNKDDDRFILIIRSTRLGVSRLGTACHTPLWSWHGRLAITRISAAGVRFIPCQARPCSGSFGDRRAIVSACANCGHVGALQ